MVTLWKTINYWLGIAFSAGGSEGGQQPYQLNEMRLRVRSRCLDVIVSKRERGDNEGDTPSRRRVRDGGQQLLL